MFYKKILIFIFIFNLLGSICLAASTLNDDTLVKMGTNGESFRQTSGYQDVTPSSIVSIVIKAFLSLLGIVFIVLIIHAGYNWMTAGGDEAKVTKAKDEITRAIIGLIIIITAYSITYFVFKALDSTVSGGGSYPP
jgi:hypothetical protein